MKKIIIVVLMLVIPELGFADDEGIRSFCQELSKSSSGTSYTLMERCIKDQSKAKVRIEKMKISSEIKSFCQELSKSSSGTSYTLMERCIRDQSKAKKRLEDAKKK